MSETKKEKTSKHRFKDGLTFKSVKDYPALAISKGTSITIQDLLFGGEYKISWDRGLRWSTINEANLAGLMGEDVDGDLRT